jgi:hypothetical protein
MLAGRRCRLWPPEATAAAATGRDGTLRQFKAWADRQKVTRQGLAARLTDPAALDIESERLALIARDGRPLP